MYFILTTDYVEGPERKVLGELKQNNAAFHMHLFPDQATPLNASIIFNLASRTVLYFFKLGENSYKLH